MRNNKKLENEIAGLKTMSHIVEAYQEIAALRMRRVKKHVLQNRDFLMGLNDIYAQVVQSYKSYPQIRKKKTISFLRETNSKSVSILLSANTGLYGEVVRATYDLFVKDIKENDTDIVIVGRYGKKYYDGASIDKPYEFFDFSDSGTDEANTKKLITHILQYEKIFVYHGYFQDILSQIPLKTAVTGTGMENLTSSKEQMTSVKYIYEPTIEDVLAFFEKGILTSIFEQSVYESSLSKFASRMISLDYAMVNIKNILKKTDFNSRKLKHRYANANQLSLLSGISLWKM
jgi:F-type H+-transporting ATPase subunit gamma